MCAEPNSQETGCLQDAMVGWGEPNGQRDPLLTGIKLKVEKGHRVLVLGPNGAGKTTLLKVVSGRDSCSCFSTYCSHTCMAWSWNVLL